MPVGNNSEGRKALDVITHWCNALDRTFVSCRVWGHEAPQHLGRVNPQAWYRYSNKSVPQIPVIGYLNNNPFGQDLHYGLAKCGFRFTTNAYVNKWRTSGQIFFSVTWRY